MDLGVSLLVQRWCRCVRFLHENPMSRKTYQYGRELVSQNLLRAANQGRTFEYLFANLYVAIQYSLIVVFKARTKACSKIENPFKRALKTNLIMDVQETDPRNF